MIGAAFLATSAKAFSPRSTVAFRHGAARAFSRTPELMANPKVFFDMEVGGEPVGRIEFELRADVVPKTGECLESTAGERSGTFLSRLPRCFFSL
jgi:hypothetical protein